MFENPFRNMFKTPNKDNLINAGISGFKKVVDSSLSTNPVTGATYNAAKSLYGAGGALTPKKQSVQQQPQQSNQTKATSYGVQYGPQQRTQKLQAPKLLNQQSVQQQPQQQSNPLLDSFGRREDLVKEGGDKSAELARQQYALNKQTLQGQVPMLDQQLADFRNTTNADIEALRAKTDRTAGTIRDEFGNTQRQAAQTLRETQGQTGRMFAGLNTTDSFGEGSYQRANENTMSDFNRFTQENLVDRSNRLADLEEGYATAERQATAAIRQKEFEMNTLKQQIQTALAQNDIDQANKLNEIYQQTQSSILDIQDALAQTQYAFQQEAMQQQSMLDELQSLSPEFLQTGRPTTDQDRMFILKNPQGAVGYAQLANPLAGGGELNQSVVQSFADAQNANTILNDVASAVSNASGVMGPVAGRLGAANPYNTDAQGFNSQMLTAAQIIGKYLEGGKLAAGDDVKYRAMLPNINDTQAAAQKKISDVNRMLQNKQQIDKQTFGSLGYATPNTGGGQVTMNQMFSGGQNNNDPLGIF